MSKLMAYTTVRHVGTQKGAVLPLLPTALLPEASVCVPSLCPSLAALGMALAHPSAGGRGGWRGRQGGVFIHCWEGASAFPAPTVLSGGR